MMHVTYPLMIDFSFPLIQQHRESASNESRSTQCPEGNSPCKVDGVDKSYETDREKVCYAGCNGSK